MNNNHRKLTAGHVIICAPLNINYDPIPFNQRHNQDLIG